MFLSDTMFIEVGKEVLVDVFLPIVCVCMNNLDSLHTDFGMPLLEFVESVRFGLHEKYPAFAGCIINNDAEISTSSKGGCLHRT